MKLIRTAALAVLLAACSGTTQGPAVAPVGEGTHSKPAPAAAASFDTAHIAAELDPYLSKVGTSWGPGFAYSGYVHLVAGDQVLYSRGFGYADYEHHVANTADTNFRIGSVTKQFTAAAIMLLAEDGKLKVTDTIRAHLPDYPAAVGDRVTIHQLLDHTSGIPSYTSDEGFLEMRTKPHTVDQLLALFRDQPLEFEPGSQFRYSNSGYIVLGAIIEKVSGTSYGEFLRTRLFEPAGMDRTVVGDADGMRDRALGYEGGAGGIHPATAIDMSVPFAAGAVRSTCTDMIRWDRALRAGSPVSAAAQKAMYTPASKMDGSGADYGYAWILTAGAGHRFAHHGGGIDGFGTYYLRALDTDFALCMWTNNTSADVGQLKEVVTRVAFGADAPELSETATIAPDTAEQAAILGTYQLTPEGKAAAKKAGASDEAIATFETIEVRAEGDGLVVAPAKQPATPIVRTAPRTYFAPQPKATLVFTIDGDEATGFSLAQGPVKLTYARK